MYRRECTAAKQHQRRVSRKYIVVQRDTHLAKFHILYNNCRKSFRKVAKEGPDYIFVVCRLVLFRDQILPFIKNNYLKKN